MEAVTSLDTKVPLAVANTGLLVQLVIYMIRWALLQKHGHGLTHIANQSVYPTGSQMRLRMFHFRGNSSRMSALSV